MPYKPTGKPVGRPLSKPRMAARKLLMKGAGAAECIAAGVPEYAVYRELKAMRKRQAVKDCAAFVNKGTIVP